MNIVTSYFLVRKLPGTIALGGDVSRHQQARQQEYLDCLRFNLQHPGVASIHLLVEGAEAYEHLRTHVLCNPAFTGFAAQRSRPLPPIVPLVRFAPGMPLYADFFAYANQLLTHRLTMVCNADVYLSPEHFSVPAVEALFHQARDAREDTRRASLSSPPSSSSSSPNASENERGGSDLALALTRYESDNVLDAPFLYDYRGSHDAFVVVPPVPPTFVTRVAHAQNGYKAENVVLHELQRSGYRTLNPTLGDGARLVHRHATDVRQWLPPVDETRYGRAPPCTLAEAAARLRDDADQAARQAATSTS